MSHCQTCLKRYLNDKSIFDDTCSNCGTYHIRFNGNGTNSVYSSCGECCKEQFGIGGKNRGNEKEGPFDL